MFIHSPVNRLVFAGDVMFSRAVRRSMLAARDPAFPFRKIACTLKQADIAFVNLKNRRFPIVAATLRTV